MGIKLEERIEISDMESLRGRMEGVDIDYLDIIKKRVLSPSPMIFGGRPTKLRFFVLDSLNALYNLQNMSFEDVRRRMGELFYLLRQTGLMSFLVLEVPEETTYRDEFFLADGIIRLGIASVRGSLKRYLQVVKMRGTQHSMDRFAIGVVGGGIKVIGEMQV